MLHVVCPRIEYLDRGKSNVALPYLPREAVINLVLDVTKRLPKQRKAEEKDASARARREERMIDRERPLNQKEAAAQVLRDAYMKASDNGTLPAKARQICYAARPSMLALTGKSTIDYGYFSQTLLVDFMKENEECADWDVVWDDRGHFEEPHGGRAVGLGTLGVREYLDGDHDLEVQPAGFSEARINTHGQPLCRAAGVAFTPHCARHSFATWLGADGASTKEIMEAGAWRDYRSVLRYTSVDEKRVRATVNRIKI